MAGSLRRRLGFTVVVIVVASWLVGALITSFGARTLLQRETDRLLEAVLVTAETVGRTIAREPSSALRDALTGEAVPVAGGRDPRAAAREQPAALRLTPGAAATGAPAMNIWAGGPHLLIGEGTPTFARPQPGTVRGRASEQQADGTVWRVMYRHDAQTGIWYAAGVARNRVPPDGYRLLLQLLLPLALVVPVTLLALAAGIARELQPLGRLVQEIGRRRGDASLAPLDVTEAPRELRPVVESLNALLARLAKTLENEQRFTSNAAHELQTPLAAISAEVQLCARLLDDAEGRRMMERIRARVERASHTVRQLLVLARLDPQEVLATAPLDLHELAQQVVSELGHLAVTRGLGVDFAVGEGERVLANREALLILLRNLVSNAFRHAREGGAVRVQAAAGRLVIDNDAAAVPDTSRLAERFQRATDGGERTVGAGLGLSIVRRICELHGFALALAFDAAAGRFRATVDFRR